VTNADALKQAIVEYGYRLVDGASFYGNQEMTGGVINEIVNVDKSLTREELFITSKVWIDEVEDIEGACKKSLAQLKLDYIDLYMVHWPIFTKKSENGGFERIKLPLYKVWEQMEALVDKGLVKSIGVSNYNFQSVWDMLSYCRIKPVVNQIELHPLCPQTKLVHFLKENGVIPMAYSPVCR